MRIFKLITRILVAVTFIVSAIMKLTSIDSFEIYIYSFGFLKLNVAYLFARFVISAELLLGFMLLINLFYKKVAYISIAMLFGFIGFLLFLLLNKNSEHCHCFGDYIPLTHTFSIFKNIVLIALLFISLPKTEWKMKFRFIVLPILAIISLAIPLVVSPPDSFSLSSYASKVSYNETLLNNYIAENNYSEGNKVLCFYGTSCRFCKMAAKKMTVIADGTDNPDIINYVFWGKPDKIQLFYSETNSTVFDHKILDAKPFLDITEGKMPLIVLIKDGVVVKKYGYRSIVDQEIIDFLNNVE